MSIKLRLPALLASVAVIGGALSASAATTPAAVTQDEAPVLSVLSTRADMVSGGDALVEVALPPGTSPSSLRVLAGKRDVTSAFSPRTTLKDAAGRPRIVGLVEGLPVGPTLLKAKATGVSDTLTVTNHPQSGPVFAGEQVQPWECRTEEAGLGKPLDAQCTVKPVVDYQYKSSTTGRFGPYDPAAPPADVATTTTDQGLTVPYVVRVEKGTINRGTYEIAVLADPGEPWTATAPQPTWNRKTYWQFGGDCQPNHRPAPAPSALLDLQLSRGFAVASSGLTVLGQNCNPTVSAETVMMVQERLAEQYGEIRYTLSEGCSGGSMQQHWIASNYPGLLDGITPSCSYPDIWTTAQQAEDCHLMQAVFDKKSPALWQVPAQQAAVAGYASPGTCRSLWDAPVTGSYARIWMDPDYSGCEGGGFAAGGPLYTPPTHVYNAQTNRKGTRCTLQDYNVHVFGTRASDGFANRPFDNVGVQYGLSALETGQITVEQFLDLNEKVGGLDIDWNQVPDRSTADPEALVNAYRSGQVMNARNLAGVPMIDVRGSSNLEIHTDVESYVTRARLDRANGHHDNQIIWTSAVPLVSDPASVTAAFLLLDQWVGAIEEDTSSRTLEQKVLANKPGTAVDACWIGGKKITDMTTCRAAFPYFSTPRLTAGAPMTDDVLKCQLKPVRASDYGVALTPGQLDRLSKVFPDGVCDYRKPGVAQQPNVAWLDYSTGQTGGVPAGPAPR